MKWKQEICPIQGSGYLFKSGSRARYLSFPSNGTEEIAGDNAHQTIFKKGQKDSDDAVTDLEIPSSGQIISDW